MLEQPIPATTAPLRWREKISYGLGDMGFNFYWANISAFLLIYYTDVFGISAAAAGTMMLITKIIDAACHGARQQQRRHAADMLMQQLDAESRRLIGGTDGETP